MGNRFTRISLVLAVLAFYGTVALACGDKFLIVGRGMHYGTAKYPASILVYDHNTEESKDLQAVLKMAGHKIDTVSDESHLHASVDKNHYDLVLMDLNDAVQLEKQIEATANKPAVLPVIYTHTGTELKEAGSKYECILKGEKKNRDLVKVVDAVMEERKKGVPLKCEWSK